METKSIRKKQESTKDNKRVFISKKAEKLIAPMSCKYLPIKAGKLSGKKFYVETNHYTEIEKKLLEQTCKKGARAEKIVSNLQTVSGYSTSKLITLWTKSYNGENKHYVKDSGWIALANFDNTINVQRSIRLFSEDPDFTTQKSNDIFLDLYKKDTESDNLMGNIVFEWNITEEGIVSAISDYAKKITPDLEKISHGKL
ncbi:hypothetical protein I3271_03395 [Photobacterium leiognathi]|uniref:hypothetical protein n=1 Tax=Photobacterium leiognathi TaxID=553611 RepID=UPI001EDE792F|nr:hypothetical protein [Photobacterium leiognathi]MCG3883726.1 hypothetical protein [Photobacterium leiognathi]